MSGLVRTLWRALAGTLAALLVAAALLLGLVRLALVQVPEYRGEIEARAGELLGLPVEIGAMDARLGFRGLVFQADRLRVLTRDGARTLFVARRGAIRLDSWALLRGKVRFDLVRLTGIAADVERGADGAWRLTSHDETLVLGGAGESAARRLPALGGLPQGRLELSDVDLGFADRLAGTGPWQFSLGELGLDLEPGRAAIELAGRLPAELGGAVIASLVVTDQDARGWPSAWQLGAALGSLDLAVLGEALGRPAWLPQSGQVEGSVSIAAAGGKPARVAGDLRARELQLAADPSLAGAAPDAAEPRYQVLAASFDWNQAPTGWQLGLAGLEVERGGRRWASPAASVTLRDEGALRRVLLEAEMIQLEDLLPGLRWVPPLTAERVLALAPSGRLLGLDLRLAWLEESATLQEFSVACELDGVNLRPVGAWPGVRNLSAYVAGNQDTGTGQLDMRDAALALPQLFRQPLALGSAAGRLEWQRDGSALSLTIEEIEVANDDAAIEGRARLRLPGGDASPWLEIGAVARDVNAAAASRYLPVGIMPGQVVRWLDRALQGGSVPEARFEFRGETRAFPFRADEGLFRVEFQWEDGVLDYSPGWPAATELDASVRFENEGLFAEVAEGRLAGVTAGPVAVSIPDLRRGELAVRGRAQGSLADLRSFVLAADLLRRNLGPGLEPATFTAGQGEAEVDLALPLRNLAATRARVDLAVSGGELNYEFLGAPVRQLEARLNIDNARVTSEQASAVLAGAPVGLQVATAEDGTVRLAATGSIDAAQLGEIVGLAVGDWAEGRSEWAGEIVFPAPGSDAGLFMGLGSNLAGTSLDLPAPAGKPAETERQVALKADFLPGGAVDVRLDWDESLRVAGRFANEGAGFVPGVLPDGGEGMGTGVVISGAVSALDLGGWLKLPWDAEAAPGGITGWVAGGRLLVGRLATPLSSYDDLLVQLSREEAHWGFKLSSERAAGSVRVPFELYGEQPLEARLERLWVEPLPVDDAPRNQTAEEGPGLAPGKVPPLDLHVDDLRYGNLRFGSVSALVLHEGDGFELVGLEGVGDGFMFQANGRSRLSEEVDASRLTVELDSDNVGQALDFLGFRRGMDARRGTFSASVEWQGGLRRDWLAAIEGEASLDIEDGSLRGVEPGAGRVFGLLSIQALPRRLALDFEDVFGEGTAFDRIAGDFRITGGSAYTENLVMRGPAAEMGVVGRTGLVARDYDQTAVISADLGVTLPVAGTVVGGPVVGAALFILSEMLQKPFETQLTYRITGPWEDPVIERISAQNRAASEAERKEEPQ